MEEEKREEGIVWYFRTWAIVLAILCFGPLGLFLLWFRPRTKLYIKVLVSVIVLILTAWTIYGTGKYYQVLSDYYYMLAEELKAN